MKGDSSCKPIHDSLQILWGGHNHKLDRPLVPKHIVRPPANAANGLDSRDTIVGDQDLFDDATFRTAQLGDVGRDVVEATVEVEVVGWFDFGIGRHG